MRAIREILLTEYIGAIVVAVLVADAFTALITTVVAQITYHLAV
jgi:large-conductance mechanosensitive channel